MPLSAVGAHGVLVQEDIVFGGGRLPGQEPHLVDTLLGHVLQDLRRAVAMEVGVVVGVDQHGSPRVRDNSSFGSHQ